MYVLSISLLLLGTGTYIVLSRKHALLLLLGLELMIQASVWHLIALTAHQVEAFVFAICVLTLAVAEVVVILALFLILSKKYKSTHIDLFRDEKEL